MRLWRDWYNGAQPHDYLKGYTPDEVYFKHQAANSLSRIEPRSKVTHRTPCARPHVTYTSDRERKFTLNYPSSKADDTCQSLQRRECSFTTKISQRYFYLLKASSTVIGNLYYVEDSILGNLLFRFGADVSLILSLQKRLDRYR